MNEPEIRTVPLDSSLVITPPESLNNIYFHNNQAQLLMTITHDGRLEIGPGLSKEGATREVAKMLVKEFDHIMTTRQNPDRRIK